MIELLLKAGADASATLWTGETVLMNCARRGADNAVLQLLKSGAKIDVHENRNGQTALMWAATEGNSNIVKSLIEHGADISKKTKNGFTPLLFAARSGDVETTRVLLDAGADPNEATDKYGNSLVIAAAGGHEALSLYLLERGADINSMDEYGITPLHYSIRRGMSVVNGIRYDPAYRVRPQNMHNLTKALLQAGADPNVQIAKNNMLGPDVGPLKMTKATPFMLAAFSVDVDLMLRMRMSRINRASLILSMPLRRPWNWVLISTLQTRMAKLQCTWRHLPVLMKLSSIWPIKVLA